MVKGLFPDRITYDNRQAFLFVLSVGFCLEPSYGCATLPDVSEKIDECRLPGTSSNRFVQRTVISEKSKAIMERLKRSVDPTDILERHIAVVESVTEAADEGNKVTLLADAGCYAACSKQYRMPETISTLKAISLKMMKQAANLPICCCKNRRKVSRSMLFMTALQYEYSRFFFPAHADGGIQWLIQSGKSTEGREEWADSPDHRKILIIDGKVAIIGGINISEFIRADFSNGNKRKLQFTGVTPMFKLKACVLNSKTLS